MIRRFLSLPRWQKQAISLTADFVLLLLAFWSALALRFETWNPELAPYGWQMLAAPLLAIPIFIRLGLYRAVIRFMEDRVVFVVAGGVTLSVLLLAAGAALTHTTGLSRGVLAIYWLLAIVYVGATRFFVRSYFLRAERSQDSRKRIAIYGAGQAGTQLAYALRAGREYQPVVFFDDNPAVLKTEVAGLRVHAVDDLAAVLAAKQVNELLLAIPSATRARRAEIIDRLEGLHCKVKLVPGMADVVSGNVAVDAIREVEIEDLLGRESVAPDAALLGRCITGKVVLVSGAGGSIGSELCRQIVRLQPLRLVLMELSEFALYSIEQELAALCVKHNFGVELVPLLGSVTHRQRNEMMMRGFGVQTVYHAAAYKHVPLVEHNPDRGPAQQCGRHAAHGGSGTGGGGGNFCSDFDRQGSAPDQCDGRQQAAFRTDPAGPGTQGWRNAVLHGALRQCARFLRFGRAAVPQADRGGWADHADPCRHHALFHDHPRGGATGDSGGFDGPGRRSLCAGHG